MVLSCPLPPAHERISAASSGRNIWRTNKQRGTARGGGTGTGSSLPHPLVCKSKGELRKEKKQLKMAPRANRNICPWCGEEPAWGGIAEPSRATWELPAWKSPELRPSPSRLGVSANLQSCFSSSLHLERGKVGGTRRHTLNPVWAVAVMGWGRGCGRWKVSRHHLAGRLLTTDSKQHRAREVCAETSPPVPPQCPPPACPAPKAFSKGCQVGGTGTRGHPKVEPPWVDPLQHKAEISSPEQGLPLPMARLAKGTGLNPQRRI